MLFAGLTSASLIKTVTWAVQRELIRAFGQSLFISFSFNGADGVRFSACARLLRLSPCGCALELLCHNKPPTAHPIHPTYGPTSRRAGLSSSDRTNTILSGKCERTGGDSGSPGEPQAHRPRPLAAYTPSEPSTQHKQETQTRQTHTYTQSPFLAGQIASLAQWQLSCTFLSPSAYFSPVINGL